MSDISDGFIRLHLVAPFVQHVEALGKDPGPTLKALGLDDRSFQDPNAVAHAEIINRVTNNLADLADDPFLGCHVAKTFDLLQWAPVADSIRDATTLAEFYTRYLVCFPKASSSASYDLHIGDSVSDLCGRHLVRTANKPVQSHGFTIGLHARLLRMLTGESWDPNSILFETPYPDSVPRGHRGLRIRKTQDAIFRLSFPTDWLFLEFKPRDTQAGLPETSTPQDLSILTALRGAALPRLGERSFGVDDLASILGLSVAKLETAVRLHGTTVPRELKRLRVASAEEALSRSEKTISEIGKSVGYSDQSHFTRFFRSQTGVAPSEYRERSRAISTQ